MMKNCPEVEKLVIYLRRYKTIEYEKNIYHTWQLEVDSNFISVFNITVIDGDNRLQLGDKQIAITDKIAKQIFGKDPHWQKLLFLIEGIQK